MQRNLTLSLLALALPTTAANATTFDIATATDVFTPTFRGDANTTWLGWDTFDDVDPNPLDNVQLIDDTTPDLGNVGTDGGRFVTNNGEDHLSGSGNYYSGLGTVAEDVSFDTAGVNGSGFTTVIVQGITLFGGFGDVQVEFGPIDGVLPTQVLQGDNAAGAAQLFAKYELPGTADTETFSISSVTLPFGTHISLDRFVIDTVWSPDWFAADSAVITPEPTAATLALLLLAGCGVAARR